MAPSDDDAATLQVPETRGDTHLFVVLLLLAAASAVPLPDRTVEQLELALEAQGGPVLVAVTGGGSRALARSASRVLGQDVTRIPGRVPHLELEGLLAVDPASCGYLIEGSLDGGATLLRLGSCAELTKPLGVPTLPSLHWRGDELAAHDGWEWLDADEFAHLVGDQGVQDSYAAAMRPTKIASIALLASSHLALASFLVTDIETHPSSAWQLNYGPHIMLSWSVTGAASAAMLIALRKWKINRLSHWYDREEVRAWVRDSQLGDAP